jgi:hypothetical protein
MKYSTIILILLVLTVISSCKTKKMKSQNSAETHRELIVEKDFKYTETKTVSIAAATIEGDVLTLTLNYHGGKGMHAFDLYFNGIIMKSMPPQVNLFLSHTHTQDNCEKLITETVSFDIKKLQMGGTGTVVIRLPGFNERLEYNY